MAIIQVSTITNSSPHPSLLSWKPIAFCKEPCPSCTPHTPCMYVYCTVCTYYCVIIERTVYGALEFYSEVNIHSTFSQNWVIARCCLLGRVSPELQQVWPCTKLPLFSDPITYMAYGSWLLTFPHQVTLEGYQLLPPFWHCSSSTSSSHNGKKGKIDHKQTIL